MANPTETGPKNIGPETVKLITAKLSQATVIYTTCCEEGLFRSAPDALTELWSEAILRHTREGKRISYLEKTQEGKLMLLEENGIKLEEIRTKDVRLMDWDLSFSNERNNLAVVGESGYILDTSGQNYVYSFGDWRRRELPVSAAQMEQILTDADRGKRPENLSGQTFVKVAPRLAGTEVALIMFQASTESNSLHIRDAIVINPETYQLIPRRVLRPLSRAKWGENPNRRPSILGEYPRGFPPPGDREPLHLMEPWYR